MDLLEACCSFQHTQPPWTAITLHGDYSALTDGVAVHLVRHARPPALATWTEADKVRGVVGQRQVGAGVSMPGAEGDSHGLGVILAEAGQMSLSMAEVAVAAVAAVESIQVSLSANPVPHQESGSYLHSMLEGHHYVLLIDT